ncbi:hypothetical protein GGR42_002335 [Saonia flava]|uniref:Glycosyltransferase n=1 Tax=Saonia flava TaxID=523696 RepID=A0A846R0B6_9FLAO|nr:TIGR04282 family arsenosugar biosynthesis glycosyltransferase [Saonia flava]NJB71873.1 hypothetical protein [Saonia flava]
MGILQKMGEERDELTIHFSLADSKNLLIIFTRNPQLGKCKTRLAATVGNKKALDIYKFLLQHTANLTRNLPVNKQVHYSEEIWEKDVWDAHIFDKKLQQGGDLGERMSKAFYDGFADGFDKICIIGSDMYDLTLQDLEMAFSALDQNDFVLGPAIDGGYYLLGMKKWKKEIFENKNWGTNTVLENTLENLKNETVKLMSAKNDVDIYEDIKDIEAFQPFLKDLKL